MKERTLTMPEIMLIAGTRVALGVGIGLLLADKLNEDHRRGAGWALLAVGVLSYNSAGDERARQKLSPRTHL